MCLERRLTIVRERRQIRRFVVVARRPVARLDHPYRQVPVERHLNYFVNPRSDRREEPPSKTSSSKDAGKEHRRTDRRTDGLKYLRRINIENGMIEAKRKRFGNENENAIENAMIEAKRKPLGNEIESEIRWPESLRVISSNRRECFLHRQTIERETEVTRPWDRHPAGEREEEEEGILEKE